MSIELPAVTAMSSQKPAVWVVVGMRYIIAVWYTDADDTMAQVIKPVWKSVVTARIHSNTSANTAMSLSNEAVRSVADVHVAIAAVISTTPTCKVTTQC